MGTVSTSHRGHNAYAPGAYGNGLKETDVAQKIHDKIMSITKAIDCTDNDGRTANDNLYNIVIKMNKIGKGVHMSQHLNAFNGSANGFEVWYYAGDSVGKKYAEAICNAVCAVTGWINRGAKATTALYVIRASTGTAILPEWGFIDSKRDMDILNKPGMMDKAINAATGALGYSINNVKPITPPSTGLAKNNKPVKNGEVGNTVLVYDALYADSSGAGRSINSRNRKGKIARVEKGAKKPYLVENWGWAHENDIELVKDATTTFDINNYHTTKFAQIKLIKDDYAYKEVSLKNKVGGKVKKGTILTVVAVEYSGKYPRFKLKSGLYITTRKDTVAKYK